MQSYKAPFIDIEYERPSMHEPIHTIDYYSRDFNRQDAGAFDQPDIPTIQSCNTRNATLPTYPIRKTPNQCLPNVCRCKCLYHTRAFTEPRFKYSISILEHAILETDDNELRAFEPRLD